MKLRFQKNLDYLSSKTSSKVNEHPEAPSEAIAQPDAIKVGSKRKRVDEHQTSRVKMTKNYLKNLNWQNECFSNQKDQVEETEI